MATSQIQLLPIFLEVDGVPVMLVEVSKQEPVYGSPYYITSVKIIYKGIHSRVIPLFVRDTKELINKLKVEITKIKFIDYMYGLDEVRRIIT
ncbi:MAG: hypothetical protein LZ173_01380 [Thaumarchaeota archaeon]|nr:hypothetical protein [Candidatus Geocrenenecus arthurdayi]